MKILSALARKVDQLVHGAERHRAYLYRTATGLASLAVAAGVVSGTKAGYVVAAVGLVLGVPNALASANSSTAKK